MGATWELKTSGTEIVLTWVEGTAPPKECGRSDPALRPEVVAWVIEVSEPGDVLYVEGWGTFVNSPWRVAGAG